MDIDNETHQDERAISICGSSPPQNPYLKLAQPILTMCFHPSIRSRSNVPPRQRQRIAFLFHSLDARSRHLPNIERYNGVFGYVCIELEVFGEVVEVVG